MAIQDSEPLFLFTQKFARGRFLLKTGHFVMINPYRTGWTYVSENDGADYKPSIVLRFLKSLARNESTTASNSKIMSGIVEFDNETMSKATYNKYISVIDRMFLTDNTLPFSTNIGSSLRIKQQEKRHLSDPSLSASLLGLTAKKLLSDLNTMGFLFESLVEHDLEIYADAIGGKPYHYQDYEGGEIDAIIELDNGEWCAFEKNRDCFKRKKGRTIWKEFVPLSRKSR